MEAKLSFLEPKIVYTRIEQYAKSFKGLSYIHSKMSIFLLSSLKKYIHLQRERAPTYKK